MKKLSLILLFVVGGSVSQVFAPIDWAKLKNGGNPGPFDQRQLESARRAAAEAAGKVGVELETHALGTVDRFKELGNKVAGAAKAAVASASEKVTGLAKATDSTDASESTTEKVTSAVKSDFSVPRKSPADRVKLATEKLSQKVKPLIGALTGQERARMRARMGDMLNGGKSSGPIDQKQLKLGKRAALQAAMKAKAGNPSSVSEKTSAEDSAIAPKPVARVGLSSDAKALNLGKIVSLLEQFNEKIVAERLSDDQLTRLLAAMQAAFNFIKE